MIFEKDREFFKKNGYLHVRNLLSKLDLHKLSETLLTLFKKYSPDLFADIEGEHLLEKSAFHKKVIEFRHKEPRLVSAIYDSIQASVAIKQIATNTKLMDAVAFLLHDHPTGLMSFDHVLRIDEPNDTKNIVDWHTDVYANEPNHTSQHGISIWAPMQKVSEKNGSIKLCVGSHRNPVIQDLKSQKHENRHYSDIYHIPQNYIDRHQVISINAGPGDVIIFPMKLVHKSGQNSSDHIRFSIVARYYKFSGGDFIPGSLQFQKSEIE